MSKKKGTEIVVNTTYGGFGLSEIAIYLLRDMGYDGDIDSIPRDHPLLVRVVKELGGHANGPDASLNVVTVFLPENKYSIEEYDGKERVVTPAMDRVNYVSALPHQDESLLGKTVYSKLDKEVWGKILSESKNVYNLTNNRIVKKKTFNLTWVV